ncbi:MAG: tripartite tricarboxylate transporter substrate binding protein [Sphaerochaetaceae bacterium]|nr:tripartite tricarboxylate transporter substrate binding protein [Sphaerochaetaceae bacterium]
MKKLLVFLMVLFLSITFVSAQGQEEASTDGELNWPTKPINLIVPYAAGGNSDFNARAVAKYLPEILGKPVVVTNVPGSGGTIGAAQVKDAKADGYTILVHQLSLSIAEAAGMANYGIKDFTVGSVFSKASPEVLVSLSDAPFDDVEELIAYTQDHPGEVKLTANTGATTMWIAIGLQNAGAKLNVVSSGGSGERLQVVLGGHADIVPLNYGMIETYVNEGTLKIIGTASNKRSELIPDVKTLREVGVNAGYDYMNTMIFPKGTDPRIVEKFSNAVGEIVMNNEKYQSEIATQYQPVTWMSVEDSEAHWHTERDELMAISDVLQGK